MKDRYLKYNNDYCWLITEEGWVRELQGVRESQFALGNGFLGSRGVLEEMPYDARPGTYLAGLYDTVGSQVAELVNLPNPFNFKITTGGEKVGVIAMEVIKHRRTLNIRHGLLCRHTTLEDTDKKRYDYQSLRFVSMADKNIGVMQVVFTPLDGPATITIETGIDTSVYNAGTVTEGRKKHFRVKELGQFKNEGFLVADTFNRSHSVIFRSGFYYETKGKKVYAKDNIFELKLKKNQTVIFTKVFYVGMTPKKNDLKAFKALSEKSFRKAFLASFSSLVNKHIKVWEDLWSMAEVSIWGDPNIEKNFRFNIYHMLICAPKDNGFSSIGAKALTGEGYRGHIFWDTEIFLFPFYLYSFPQVAKSMLLYRYQRLDAARQLAKENGYQGAMFPWESASSGKDETPDRAKDLDGRVIRIHTGQKEHHITADIAYAFYHYYNITADEEFLAKCGYELFFETARFWASRVKYNKRKKTYTIDNVIGPDEFHKDVNNNAFTNMMAKWNLILASKMYQKAHKDSLTDFKRIAQKIGLSSQEARQWKKIASGIPVNMNKKQVIEQFDGYFKKKYIKLNSLDENNLPTLKEKLTPREYERTQLIKQADVVMLLNLLSDVFNLKTKKSNYEYYLARTLHKSSLSLPAYALVAVDMGDKGRAYNYFRSSVNVDIANIHKNTAEGMHAACIGATWQALVNGFAGIKIKKDILTINPKLPSSWRKIFCRLRWRGNLLHFELKNDRVRIEHFPLSKKKTKLKVFGAKHELSGQKKFDFKRKRAVKKEQSYYL